MNASPGSQSGQLSPDGNHYWDGERWLPAGSADGRHRWNGVQWIPSAPVADPLSAGPVSQFSGRALTSIIVGAVSIIVPVVALMATGGSSYFAFRIAPIIGIVSGVIALTRRQFLGGSIGIALNVVGGLITIALLLGSR